MDIQQMKSISDGIRANVEKVIVGKSHVIELVLAAMLAEGHVLLEDVPGTGKTMMAKALAKSIDTQFKRIQFTPDLLPSDLIGINYYNQKEGEFVFRQGALFTNVLLADEINRATPRTQSSLLESMEEKQITVDGTTYVLEKPFFVIATQNPVENPGYISPAGSTAGSFYYAAFHGLHQQRRDDGDPAPFHCRIPCGRD